MDAKALTGLLWPKGNGTDALQVYALLDSARDEAIAPAIWGSQLPYECLYAGILSHALQSAAPYLVHLAPESRFFSKIVSEGWGHAWGIFVIAHRDVTLKALRRHFRTLLRVNDEQKRMLVFRFYDPRVLRIYLPTCTELELSLFFGPVGAFACENEAGDDLIRHQRSDSSFGGVRSGLPSHTMNILTIRAAQLDAQRHALTAVTIARLTAVLLVRFPDQARPRAHATVREVVAICHACAPSFGLASSNALGRFAHFVLEFGTLPDFADGLRAASEILGRPRRTTSARLMDLEERARALRAAGALRR